MYKLLDHFWHAAHADRLNALPVKRDYIWHDPWPMWNEHHRPFPPNNIIETYEPGVYDAVILHVDEVCWRYHTMAPQFRELRPQIQEPIIVINHGTPDDDTDKWMMRDWLDGCHMVVNSKTAAEQWGWGTPIIHGYDPAEWPINTERREPEIITACGGWRGYHHTYNGCDLLENLHVDTQVTWLGIHESPKSFDEYRQRLAQATIYLNTTRRSPMPGARTEAMLMGLCVVTLPGQDVENYIEPGVTGFIGQEDELQDILRRLLAQPDKVREVGLAGALAAREHFTVERYVTDWIRFLDSVLGG